MLIFTGNLVLSGQGRLALIRRHLCPGQTQREDRPSGARLELDLAPHHAGELTSDREPEPTSSREPGVRAIEALEHVSLVFRCDAGPAVLDAKLDCSRRPAGCDPDLSSRWRMDDRVLEQDPADLANALVIRE